MAQGKYNDISSFGHVLRHSRKVVMAEIQGHKVTDGEEIRGQTRIMNSIVIGIQYLWR